MSISLLQIGIYCTVVFLLVHRRRRDNHEVVLFMFGDSIFDVGTNDYTNASMKGNFIPYGETFFTYPTGRISDGRLIPDFIAEYAGLPLIPPYLQPNFTFDGGANFASAGSGALVETNLELNVINLETQVRQFEQLRNILKNEFGDEKANETMSKAIYLVSVGGNDLLYAYMSSSDVPYEQLVAMVIHNVTSVVKSIYSKGGRKFGFLSVMPLGCVPNERATTGDAGTCVADLNLMATIYNLHFQQALANLEVQLDGFKYSIFDFYNTLFQRIHHPSTYGLIEGKNACCGSGSYNGNFTCGSQSRGEKEYNLCKDPGEYVFFDCFHPTQTVYQQLADLMWNGGHDVIRPYNLRTLMIA